MTDTQRLAKAIAQAGHASRRDAEKLIEMGRVNVNGQVVKTPAFNVSSSDVVSVDGQVLKQPPLRLWLYHKPTGLVTTARDEKGRKTIFDELPPALKNVNTVGRLDLNSEGLLLLTNHGGLKRSLELPDTGWRRKYRVRAYGKVNEKALETLRNGVKVDGLQFRPMEIAVDREQGDNIWYTVGLREGKNREIRRAFETVNLQVNRLIRVSYGPFQLGAMEKGEVAEMGPKALRTLLGGLLPEGVEIAEGPLDLSVEDVPLKDGKFGARKSNFGKSKGPHKSSGRSFDKPARAKGDGEKSWSKAGPRRSSEGSKSWSKDGPRRSRDEAKDGAPKRSGERRSFENSANKSGGSKSDTRGSFKSGAGKGGMNKGGGKSSAPRSGGPRKPRGQNGR